MWEEFVYFLLFLMMVGAVIFDMPHVAYGVAAFFVVMIMFSV